MRSLTAIVLALCALGCAPGPGGGPPPTDSCATPSSGTVDMLEVGAATPQDLAGGAPSTFAPLHDGDGMTLIAGGQGANMLGFILRISGATAPACLGQKTTVTDSGGNRVTSASPPLATYAQADGTRLTHPLWMPADYPASFVVTVAAGDQSVALQLHLIFPQ